MFGNSRFLRWLVGAAILAVAEFACVAAVEFASTVPAQAQFFGDDRYRQRPQRSGGFFQQLFGPFNSRPSERDDGPPAQQPREQSFDGARAPSPHKPDSDAAPVTTSVVVMGDGMADWLAYGLEDAFEDSPEIGIVRKNKLRSGLLRYEAKGDLDWWHVARDILAQEKPNYVVMMLGVSDRQNIRERDLAKEAEKNKTKDQPDKTEADRSAPAKDQAEDADAIIAPEPQAGRRANGTIEFRTEQWAQIYSRRIDETIAALKSKGVPVFWVGLPSIRGPKSTADAVYLNDLYRARAEKAGAIYIDVWDGFVDEGGKFTTNGPDYEGQVRRLRSGDGVYFTKYGARKLAHYVERELRRYMSNRALPVALPAGPVGPAPADGQIAARPLAGPVVPLTMTTGNSDELLGGSGSRPAQADAIAARVLVKGEPVPAPSGRADDFVWPRGSEPKPAQPVAAAPAASVPAANASVTAAAAAAGLAAVFAPNPTSYTEPPAAAPEKKTVEPKRVTPEKTTQNVPARAKPQRLLQPQYNAPPRPPQPVRPANDPFGWLR
jgi:hypothetical protein